MKPSDVNRRCVVYDRPRNEGNGILGTIVEVLDSWTFRIRTDKGTEYDMSLAPRGNGEFTPWVKYLDIQEAEQ
jgi:hypothetical protein